MDPCIEVTVVLYHTSEAGEAGGARESSVSGASREACNHASSFVHRAMHKPSRTV